MEWGTLKRRALIGILLISLLISTLAAGNFGWLGKPIQELIALSIESARLFLRDHGTELDQLWKFAGGVISILSGCWFIVRSWNYAEHRLPVHLAHFVERRDERLRHCCSYLLQLIESRTPTTSPKMGLSNVGPLNDTLRKASLGEFNSASQSLDEAIKTISSQKDLWAKHKRSIEDQLSAAYLLKGVILSAKISYDGSTQSRQNALDAEKYFDLAVTHSPKDPQPLVYRGFNAMFLGNLTRALEDFTRALKLIPHQKGDLYARACFGAGQIRAEMNSRGRAATLLESAIEALSKDASESMEAAEMHKLLGEVREASGLYPSAIDATTTAVRILRKYEDSKARAILLEAEGTLGRLRAYQNRSNPPGPAAQTT